MVEKCLQGQASIERILSLNSQAPEVRSNNEAHANGLIPQSTAILNENGEPIWKVLVFDNLGRDIISSVLRVNDLRSRGVTIHLYVGLRLQPNLLLDTN
jgi:sec1 family domain-containing protein 1